MAHDREPIALAQALSELIALRGLDRPQGDAQLQAVWDRIAGPVIARQTKIQGLSRGVLQVLVGNGAMLSELTAFHKTSLLAALKKQLPEMKLKDLKFKLQTSLRARNQKDETTEITKSSEKQ